MTTLLDFAIALAFAALMAAGVLAWAFVVLLVWRAYGL
jgi:hypothetical protein